MSLLLGFFVILAIAGFLGLGAVAFFLPVVWLYAFFDSYNLRSRILDGTAPQDEYLFGLSEMDSQRMAELLRRRHSVIGWGLVMIGIYLLYQMLLNQLWWMMGDWFLGDWLYSLLRYDVPRLVMTILVILLGLWFIRGPKARKDDIPDFVPPAQSGAQAAPEETTQEEPNDKDQ